jgi:hypothetical protein
MTCILSSLVMAEGIIVTGGDRMPPPPPPASPSVSTSDEAQDTPLGEILIDELTTLLIFILP